MGYCMFAGFLDIIGMVSTDALRAEWHVTHGFGNMALARPACAVHVMPGCLRA
eukprot:COSAG03_NODE_28955_length_192_cov_15.408602_1_plen_52_part_01